MDNFIVEYFETEEGVLPAEKFILSQNLDDGIFELRAKIGTNITRILYFFVMNRKVILTNGFIKKVQKTPQREIETAKKYRADYLRRSKEK